MIALRGPAIILGQTAPVYGADEYYLWRAFESRAVYLNTIAYSPITSPNFNWQCYIASHQLQECKMIIEYSKREFLVNGLSEAKTRFRAPLGYFLFVEARCFFGVLQPYNMLRKIMGTGRLISADNIILEWKPFRLSRIQYEETKRSLLDNPEWGGEVDDGFQGSRQYWQRWAILRSLGNASLLAS